MFGRRDLLVSDLDCMAVPFQMQAALPSKIAVRGNLAFHLHHFLKTFVMWTTTLGIEPPGRNIRKSKDSIQCFCLCNVLGKSHSMFEKGVTILASLRRFEQ